MSLLVYEFTEFTPHNNPEESLFAWRLYPRRHCSLRSYNTAIGSGVIMGKNLGATREDWADLLTRDKLCVKSLSLST